MRRELFLRTTAAFGAGLALAACQRGPANVPDYQPSPEPSVTFTPNAWVHVRTDGTVAVLINKSEMGQGVYTGLPMLVAEEMDLPFDRVRVQFAPVADEYNDPVFKDQTTGGSTSIQDMYPIMRGAGAAARAMLIAAAAKQWNVDPASCTTKDGQVLHAGSNRSASYADLAVAASAEKPPQHVQLKDASKFTLIGTSPKRLDLDAKVRAKTTYGIDVVVPGMVYANVLKSPTFGGTVATLDDSAARKVKGVVDVVKISSGVAVVASNTYAAMSGRDALKVTWNNTGPAAHISTPKMFADAEKLARTSGVVAGQHGDVDGAHGTSVEAVYYGPFLAHAAMEPMNATADVRDDAVEVWAPTQVQTRSRDGAMKVTGFPASKVTVHTTFLGGGFGRRLDADYVLDAVEISKAVKKPVKVTWRREDDIKNDFYRPMSVNVVRGKLDGSGRVVAWEHRVASPSIVRRWAPPMFKNGVDFSAVDSVTPAFYAFPNLRTTYADFEPGVPVGFMRAPGANWNTFVTESFVDELAHQAGKDPLAFRLALLDPKKGARVRGVLQLAADKAGWGHPRTPGASQGVAVCDWGGSLGALVAEVTVSGKNVTVHRAVMAADCGVVVHPDIVAAQLEGAINYGIAMAMTAKITFTDGKVDQNNFYDYTVLRMKDAPAIETHIVKSTEKPSGIGELGTPPIAPAIANAIFKATGKRVRRLPFSDGLT
ncbi:MAG TPA: molybdopterin cofactor-binding domain-containing protein [Candidatus Elarobacter sp.]|jgi:isoquinoline 1-oxidoreductase beta subunit|nr:molybdopterin cofactor-binding domain-containing protein [Candidatus Elarobacter sp.]